MIVSLRARLFGWVDGLLILDDLANVVCPDGLAKHVFGQQKLAELCQAGFVPEVLSSWIC